MCSLRLETPTLTLLNFVEKGGIARLQEEERLFRNSRRHPTPPASQLRVVNSLYVWRKEGSLPIHRKQ